MIGRSDQPGPWTMAFRLRTFVDVGRGRLERARETPATADRGSATRRARLVGGADAVESRLRGVRRRRARGGRRRGDADARMPGSEWPAGDGSRPERTTSTSSRSSALGDADRARATLERLEERSRTLPRLWINVTLPRARALVLLAEGEFEGGAGGDRRARRQPRPRSCLSSSPARGSLRGRLPRRQKPEASGCRGARATRSRSSERLGAPGWHRAGAQRTRSRRPPRRRSPDELTATELRVAETGGRRAHDVKSRKRAFISAKTVEANLARVYRKLGIRSRAELGSTDRAARRGEDHGRRRRPGQRVECSPPCSSRISSARQ